MEKKHRFKVLKNLFLIDDIISYIKYLDFSAKDPWNGLLFVEDERNIKRSYLYGGLFPAEESLQIHVKIPSFKSSLEYHLSLAVNLEVNRSRR